MKILTVTRSVPVLRIERRRQIQYIVFVFVFDFVFVFLSFGICLLLFIHQRALSGWGSEIWLGLLKADDHDEEFYSNDHSDAVTAVNVFGRIHAITRRKYANTEGPKWPRECPEWPKRAHETQYGQGAQNCSDGPEMIKIIISENFWNSVFFGTPCSKA